MSWCCTALCLAPGPSFLRNCALCLIPGSPRGLVRGRGRVWAGGTSAAPSGLGCRVPGLPGTHRPLHVFSCWSPASGLAARLLLLLSTPFPAKTGIASGPGPRTPGTSCAWRLSWTPMCPTPWNMSSTSSWRSVGRACSQVRGSGANPDGGQKEDSCPRVGRASGPKLLAIERKGQAEKLAGPEGRQPEAHRALWTPISCSPSHSPKMSPSQDRFQGCPHLNLSGFLGETCMGPQWFLVLS